MTSANVELVRSIYAAWERGDFGRAPEWAHPGIEYVNADGPAPGIWTGVSGMAEGFREVLAAWHEFRVEANEFRELDDERVLVLIRYRGSGKTSGLELAHIRSNGASLFEIRGGKVTKLVNYFTRERTFADLGLTPDVE